MPQRLEFARFRNNDERLFYLPTFCLDLRGPRCAWEGLCVNSQSILSGLPGFGQSHGTRWNPCFYCMGMCRQAHYSDQQNWVWPIRTLA